MQNNVTAIDKEDMYFLLWLKDKDNRKAYQAFLEIALAAKRGGMKRWSARGIAHVMRYQTAISDGDKTFKINNNATPMLARQAHKDEPELTGFFETRRLIGSDK